ncbi:hypothetical protein [Pseudomonas asplenii]|uniref:hypothetical protein n=1 Tax=Pseudomonas asplenii TaxID=53407 RepID=UPI002362A70B|nr:hypothetical protein [Pseudomonas asplenii]
MSIINCRYLPYPAKPKFPSELALSIARKFSSLADAFGQLALDQFTRDATSAIAAGADPRHMIRQMLLYLSPLVRVGFTPMVETQPLYDLLAKLAEFWVLSCVFSSAWVVYC